MKPIYPPELLTLLKDKFLLLDTNVFIDSFNKPTSFFNFFNELKKVEVLLSTINLVKYEFLKGSANMQKYNTKNSLLSDIIDAEIPITKKTYELAYDLIKRYGVDGHGLKITDLILGACLLQYKKHVFLLTRDTTDFLQRIFNLNTVVNIPHAKGIWTYGVYSYK